MTTMNLMLTDSAKTQVMNLIKSQNLDNPFLRVSVVGGGCSGFMYKLALQDAPAENDIILDMGEFKVIVDMRSSLFLEGTTVDYLNDLNKSGFAFNNPNAKRGCGCGQSFG